MNTHTRFSKETCNNLERYLTRTGGHMYTKNAGSSEGALWERPDFTATLRLTDLTHNYPIDYALFEFFPGIMVRVSKGDENEIDIPCYKNVAAYGAEFIKPGFGAMDVSRKHRDIYFKFEFPIRENALSENTIEILEKRAAELIALHRENLAFLANTYVPYSQFRKFILENNKYREKKQIATVAVPANVQMYHDSLNSIRNHLEKYSNHNIIAESMDEDGNPTWKCEIFSDKNHYFLDLSVDPRTGFLILKAIDGPKSISIDVDSRREVAAYMAETSSTCKVGFLWCGDDTEGICVVTNASLADGIIGSETFELMEGLVIKLLDRVRAKVYALSYGKEMECDNKVNDDSILEMLSKMCDDEEEDDSDDDGPVFPFCADDSSDFDSMLADVLVRTRKIDEEG